MQGSAVTPEYIIKHLKDQCGISALKVFNYGSRVYGNNSYDSDYDFVAIVAEPSKSSVNGALNELIPFDVSIYTIDEFQKRIDSHEISALECLWVDSNPSFIFNLNKEKLRDAISAKVSHCWVKGKKKLTVGSEPPRSDDRYLGLKSIFHAFRICEFGTQIAIHGCIVDYSASNSIWVKLQEFKSSDWNTIYSEFKTMLNESMTKFRVLCPKIVVDNVL